MANSSKPNQTPLEIEISPGKQGFRYFWAKRVTGFNPATHCYACLKGKGISNVNLDFATGGATTIPSSAGDLVYICGVARPRKWANNFHLALRVKLGARCSAELHTGSKVSVENGEPIPISDVAAVQLFPDRSSHFLTCRNFQFAAQMFGDPAVAMPQSRNGDDMTFLGNRA